MRRATSRMCDVKPKASISSSTPGRGPPSGGAQTNADIGPSGVAIVSSACCMRSTLRPTAHRDQARYAHSAAPAEQDEAEAQEAEPEERQDHRRLHCRREA